MVAAVDGSAHPAASRHRRPRSEPHVRHRVQGGHHPKHGWRQELAKLRPAMTRRRGARNAAVLAAAIAIIAGAIWWFASRPPRIDPTDARQVAAGAAVYRAHCATCHGANLEGQPDWR